MCRFAPRHFGKIEKHCASSCNLKPRKFQFTHKMNMVALSRLAWDCCIITSLCKGYPRTSSWRCRTASVLRFFCIPMRVHSIRLSPFVGEGGGEANSKAAHSGIHRQHSKDANSAPLAGQRRKNISMRGQGCPRTEWMHVIGVAYDRNY